ncbi:MAG: peptidoglycan DD-metalloendopeptidase family protein [Chloroflexi bacterium]|nr:peptidoglycan DD-metalloendopeptidase family protein [Chloroflexota bacterium]
MSKRSKFDRRAAAIGLALIAALACARENVRDLGGRVPTPSARPQGVSTAIPQATPDAVPTPTPPGTLDSTPEIGPTATPIDIPGPATRLVPDTELVYGPSAATFDLLGYIESQDGYLKQYSEDVFEQRMSGGEIVRLVALNYSINPRLLLALLENQSGFVTNPNPGEKARTYPLAREEAGREGLYHQLAWAADTLNRGYYGWRENTLTTISFSPKQRVVIDKGLNAGTVALQYFFASYYSEETAWLAQLGPQGLTGTYRRMFGDPFAFTAPDPLAPPDLIQLPLSWPWDPTETWYFIGGPHGAYESGSAWAALDFAPPGQAAGCARNDAWLRAAAPGVVVRSDHGVLALDLGEGGNIDGLEQTGWVLFYLHVESRDRAPVGKVVNTGDPVGHPGCEGGSARGVHLHFARKYNGEWIPAVGPPPFDLSGWTPTSRGVEYSGDLVGGDYTLSACECRSSVNAIKVGGR